MNDMSAPFTNSPESELALLRADDRVKSHVSRSARSLPVASHSREYPSPSESMVRGDYRASYAVCVTVAVTSLSVARNELVARRTRTRATAFRILTNPLPFSFVG
jgi:hypothetical protein